MKVNIMMKRLSFSIFTAVALSGCSLESWVDQPAVNAISLRNYISGSTGEFASGLGSGLSTCATTNAYLYKLDELGRKIEPAVTVKPVSGGKFKFTDLPAKEWVLTNQGITQPVLLQITGCGQLMARLVTSSEAQNVDEHSTLLTFALNSAQGAHVVSKQKSARGLLFNNLHTILARNADVQASAAQLQGSLATAYNAYAGGSALALNSAAPIYQIEQMPTILTELGAAEFSVVTSHWNPSYQIAVEWLRDSSVISRAATDVFTPQKNDQGLNTYRLRVGAADGAGHIDNAQDVLEYWAEIVTSNDFPPIVPALTLASSALTSNSTVHLRLSTGAAMANCATFSKIAVTENDTAAPPPTAFDTQNRACSVNLNQYLSHTLANTSDGVKTLRVWTMDADGNVSVIPALATMTLDASAPALGFSTPAANSEFNSTLTINGTCENDFMVDVAGAGALASQAVACAASAFTVTVTPTAGQGVKTVTIS
jgi:hypothetical protein